MNRPINLLIVEDDPMAANVNRKFIESVGGFRVLSTSSSGREAIRLIEELTPDLTILDIFLPDLDGVGVLKEIRRLGLPTDVILVTAVQDAAIIQDVLRYGAVDYIIKPFKFERMKQALESYRQMRSKLSAGQVLSQDQVDKMTIGKAGPIPELPKGLTDWTLRQVMLFLVKEGRPLSAQEVADGVGLARVTARRYLEYLVDIEQVRLEVQYGSVGRPVNRYHV